MSIAEFSGFDIHPIGMPLRQLSDVAVASLSDLSVSTANYAVIWIGHLCWTDRASHTVDTSGSSSIGWRSSSVTFANAGTTVKVGIAAVDTSNGPPGRASNTAAVINFDVAASFTGGGGGITANAWNESVPTTGSKTIGHGELVAICIQMPAKGGSDVVNVRNSGTVGSGSFPAVTLYNGAYSSQAFLPNCTVRASDGTRGYILGGNVASVLGSAQTYNTGTTIKECGNLIQVPYPCKAYGSIVCPNAAGSCDFDLILYEDPLGTPISRASVSIDANTVTGSGFGTYEATFSTGFGFTLAANTPYAIVAKPTTANSLNLFYRTFGNSAHQACIPGGANGYAVNRNTGAFAAQNSQLDRFDIGLLVGGGDTGGIVYPRPGLQGISQGLSR